KPLPDSDPAIAVAISISSSMIRTRGFGMEAIIEQGTNCALTQDVLACAGPGPATGSTSGDRMVDGIERIAQALHTVAEFTARGREPERRTGDLFPARVFMWGGIEERP